jgi:protein involved in polysaccharide export with SLBB domain
VNGKLAFTMGAGEMGLLTASVSLIRTVTPVTQAGQHVSLMGRGKEQGGASCQWPDKRLAVGDEVTIRIAESATFDEPARKSISN